MEELKEGRKCIVYCCSNTSDNGSFNGDMCMPCFEIITTGHIKNTDSFLGECVESAEYDRLVKNSAEMMEHYANCKRDRDMWSACAISNIRILAELKDTDFFSEMSAAMSFISANKHKVTRT